MKLKISRKELLRLRKEIEAVSPQENTNNSLFVSIALPYDCNEATHEYAYALTVALRRVNCNADTNTILSFSASITSDKPYEVLPYIPIATPCIRVYKKSEEDNVENGIRKTLRNLHRLLAGNRKE